MTTLGKPARQPAGWPGCQANQRRDKWGSLGTDVGTGNRTVFEPNRPNRTVRADKVQVRVPAISENGYSVPVAVEVDSPMTRDDHVRRIAVVSEANPLAVIAQFELGPQAALAKVNTRIRLADSQRVYAVAEMNDGTLWTGYGHSIVTLAACVI